MKNYRWILVLIAVALLIAEVAYIDFKPKAPSDEYSLNGMRFPVPGAEMVLENIRFEPESGNILRIRGSYVNGAPPEKYEVKGAIGESADRAASGEGTSHYTLLPPVQGVPGNHFFIDFESAAAMPRVIFCHIKLIDKETQAVGAEFMFQANNPARKKG